MSDAAHYQANLAGERVPIHDGAEHVKVGYYKLRRVKDGPWLPCAIWKDPASGNLVARVADEMAVPEDIWLYCVDNPVPKAEALHAFQHGVWPGDAPPAIGSNNPPSDDPLDTLTRELDAEHARVAAWVAEPHEGKTAADLAANWLFELRKLEKRVEGAFDTEKAPALAESNRIDLRWRPAKALAEKIKRVMTERYEAIGRKEKKRLQDIADAKAREEAEKRRREWEAEQVKIAVVAEEQGVYIAPEEKAPPPVVLAAEPVKVAFGGAAGARVGLKKIPATALVEDWAKAAAHFAGNAKIRELVQKLADKCARDSVPVPGVKIIPGD